jgi:hypothetical protein
LAFEMVGVRIIHWKRSNEDLICVGTATARFPIEIKPHRPKASPSPTNLTSRPAKARLMDVCRPWRMVSGRKREAPAPYPQSGPGAGAVQRGGGRGSRGAVGEHLHRDWAAIQAACAGFGDARRVRRRPPLDGGQSGENRRRCTPPASASASRPARRRSANGPAPATVPRRRWPTEDKKQSHETQVNQAQLY